LDDEGNIVRSRLVSLRIGVIEAVRYLERLRHCRCCHDVGVSRRIRNIFEPNPNQMGVVVWIYLTVKVSCIGSWKETGWFGVSDILRVAALNQTRRVFTRFYSYHW